MRIRREGFLLVAARIIAAGALGALALPLGAEATTITVSPGSSIAAAVAGASAGDIIDVQPGTYTNDFPVVNVPLTIQTTGAPGSVIINDTGIPNNQGIITNNSSLKVVGLTIIGAATVPGQGDNAGAIRDHSSTNLTVIDSLLEDSQNGILTEDPTRSETISIQGTTFLQDGSGAGDTHALYVGDAASLDVENSIFCGTNNGHDVKSRATTTTVSGSTMYVGATGPGCAVAGTTGAGIDAPNGGVVDLVSDSIIQGSTNSNGALIIMGGESPLLANNALTITNTTLSGDGASDSIGVNELSGCIAPVSGSGNTVSGLNKDINPTGCGSLNAAVAVDEPRTLGILASALALLAFSRWKRERPGLMLGCAGAGLGDRARAAPGFIMRG